MPLKAVNIFRMAIPSPNVKKPPLSFESWVKCVQNINKKRLHLVTEENLKREWENTTKVCYAHDPHRMHALLSEASGPEATALLANVARERAEKERHTDVGHHPFRHDLLSETRLVIPHLKRLQIQRLRYPQWIAKVRKANPGVDLDRATVDDALRASLKALVPCMAHQFLLPVIEKVQDRLLKESD